MKLIYTRKVDGELYVEPQIIIGYKATNKYLLELKSKARNHFKQFDLLKINYHENFLQIKFVNKKYQVIEHSYLIVE